MKISVLFIALFEFHFWILSREKKQVVEAACGQCQFKMKDKKGCDLAVRIDGKSYFVEGTKIDEHGDAHADDGFAMQSKSRSHR